MAGWGKLVAGALIGVAGTVYATNEEVRKRLPKKAQDLPESVKRRFDRAMLAGRNAASSRREEILRDLKEHGGDHDHGNHGENDLGSDDIPQQSPKTGPLSDETQDRASYESGDSERLDEFFAGSEDDTRSIPRIEQD